MSILNTLTALAARNIELRLTDAKLKVVAAKGAVGPDDMTFLKGHKEQILACYDTLGVTSNRQFESLTANQQQLWLVDKIEGQSVHYNMPLAFALNGRVDGDLLKKAIELIVQRHSILRTVYREFEGEPVQVVREADDNNDTLQLPFETVNLMGHSDMPSVVSAKLLEHSQYAFDLSTDVMIRVLWIEQTPDESVLALNLHHIAADGWSMGVLFEELAICYQALVANQTPNLPALPIQYLDYANWQKQQLEGDNREKLNQYWMDKLGGMPQVHGLPLDYSRPAQATTEAGVIATSLDKTTSDKLHELARKHDVSLFMLLNAAFAVLLYRHSGQTDIVFGTPSANREHSKVSSLIGYFVNTLVIRNQLTGDMPFEQLLQGCRTTLLEAYEHQQMPFEALVEQLQPTRDLRFNPLFQVMLSHENLDFSEQSMSGLSMSLIEPAQIQAKFDLSLSVVSTEQGLQFGWDYAAALFSGEHVEQMASHMMNLLCAAMEKPDASVSELAMLSDKDIERQLTDFNPGWLRVNGADKYHHQSEDFPTLSQLFTKQVERYPSVIALEAKDKSYTYQQLDSEANRLAHYLIEQGVVVGDRVGIYLPRSADIVICVLAIYKAGAAYVPLDSGYPEDRLQYMAQNADVKLVLTCAEQFDAVAITTGLPVMLDSGDVQSALANQATTTPDIVGASSADLAYIMYTSGSTGQPKGVMIEQVQVSSYQTAIHELYQIPRTPEQAHRLYACSAFSFDIFVEEMVLSVFSGNTMVLGMSGLSLDASELCTEIEQMNINILSLPTAYWHYLAETLDKQTTPVLSGLSTIIIGGEAMSLSHLRRWQKQIGSNNVQVFNVYGPTETTVVVTGINVSAFEGEVLPIGQCHGQALALVLDSSQEHDESLNLLPIGAIGELCIAGPVVGRGYWQRPDQSEQVFTEVTLPGVAEPVRVYRTGDLVRWLPDGQLGFIGRVDSQVKVRGYRVELSEIQTRIEQLAGVENAVVAVRPDAHGILQIFAWVVGKEVVGKEVVGHSVDPDTLRAQLHGVLPEYMVPKAIGIIDALPITHNGKVDVKSLAQPEVVSDSGAPCETELQMQLAAIWCGLLTIEEGSIGLNDDFFALGGHSLLATRLVSAIQQHLECNISIRDIFANSKLGDLAVLVEKNQGQMLDPITLAPPGASVPITSGQQSIWFVHQLDGSSVQYNMPTAIRLEGELNVQAVQSSLDNLVDRHALLRTTFGQDENGEGVMLVQPAHAFAIETVDLTDVSSDIQEQQLEQQIAERVGTSIDITQEWPLKVTLFRLAANEHVLLFNTHHIASDGWSMGIMADEFMAGYSAFASGCKPQLAELPVQYADVAYWQQQKVAEQDEHPQLAYWGEQMSDAPQLHQLPLDYARPAKPDYSGQYHAQQLSGELSARLQQLAKQHNVTMYMLMESMFALLIGRWSHQQDVVIGCSVAGRERSELEGLIGYFVNILPLRSQFDEQTSVADYLAASRTTILDAYAHQDVAFDAIVEHLRPERSLSHTPIVQILFSLQNTGDVAFELPGLEVSGVGNAYNSIKYDMNLSLVENPEGIEVYWNSATALFDPRTIETLAGGYETLLSALCDNPVGPISQLSMASAKDIERLGQWQGEVVDYPQDKPMVEYFEAHAAANPDEQALVCQDQVLSFGELESRANQMAHAMSARGIKVGDPVAICLKRSTDSVVAFLACHKIGAGYVPVDAGYPKQRIDYIISDFQCVLMLTTEQLIDELTLDQEICLALDTTDFSTFATTPVSKTRALTMQDVAYVIYTSGTTGNPKGAILEQGNLLNFFYGYQKNLAHIDNPHSWLMTASFSFDASMVGLCCLCHGMRLVVAADDEAGDPQALVRLLKQYDINTCKAPVSMIEDVLSVLEQEDDYSVHLSFGGEKVAEPLWRRLEAYCAKHNTQGINAYGPTETTVNTSYSRVNVHSGSSIGTLMDNYSGYILDRGGNRLPVGAVGELFIGGLGVGKGYHQLPDVTEKSYLPNPYDDMGKGRMYRSGDLVRFSQDGELIFVARADKQVKLRGFRVELGEVMTQLGQVEGVTNAIVDVRGTGVHQRLVAYVMCEGDKSNEAIVQQAAINHLSANLPDFMVPSALVFLDELPRTANGKVDYRALPEPAMVAQGEYQPPEGEIEAQLAQIWQPLLGLSRAPGRNDNFFTCGGNSILAIRLLNSISGEFDLSLALRSLFEYPVLQDMATHIDEQIVVRDNAAQLDEDDEDMEDMEW